LAPHALRIESNRLLSFSCRRYVQSSNSRRIRQYSAITMLFTKPSTHPSRSAPVVPLPCAPVPVP
jgi:hypothetical protein